MEPFIGEVRLFGFGLVPQGWMPCEGQTMAISNNQALFSILGTQFGGDGVSTFKLPDLRGRVPVGVAPSYPQGQPGGEEAHALSAAEIPSHSHTVTASSASPDQSNIVQHYWASTMSFGEAPDATMATAAIGTAGNGAPHNNMQPYLALNFCVAISGVYPPRP